MLSSQRWWHCRYALLRLEGDQTTRVVLLVLSFLSCLPFLPFPSVANLSIFVILSLLLFFLFPLYCLLLIAPDFFSNVACGRRATCHKSFLSNGESGERKICSPQKVCLYIYMFVYIYVYPTYSCDASSPGTFFGLFYRTWRGGIPAKKCIRFNTEFLGALCTANPLFNATRGPPAGTLAVYE